MPLAKWKCHKIVQAGRIIDMGDALASVLGIDGVEHLVMAPNVFARGKPSIGDYIVIYDDGYMSWSPAKAFAEGYTREPAQ